MLMSLLRFTAAHKRRQQNRPYPIGLCPKWCSKELSESPFLLLSLLLKAQCRLNLEKANTNNSRRKKCDERQAKSQASASSLTTKGV